MKRKKDKKLVFKEGDTVYYETPNGIESDTIMMIDGQELTLSDYGCLYKRDCLSVDDPRVVEHLKNNKK